MPKPQKRGGCAGQDHLPCDMAAPMGKAGILQRRQRGTTGAASDRGSQGKNEDAVRENARDRSEGRRACTIF
jgi:hypothetical protein